MIDMQKYNKVTDDINDVLAIVSMHYFPDSTRRHIEEIKQLLLNIKCNVITKDTDIEALHFWIDGALTIISIEQFQNKATL
ncbi:hypothetical protein [Morganella morganii]|uniref:hypothetical protein n=1 Tax=Morganella morganii TaxID=582 RepID=UPI0021CDF577|nr:hypothetical protein [Morganella morganii]MCU6224189.1 hypothetical protein [Morganella morganii]MCU6234641.1 hypothetical protein [Morganella morganii]